MLHFVSTFPPAACGIGSYTSYLSESLPPSTWKVSAFRLKGCVSTAARISDNAAISYSLILGDGRTLSVKPDEVVWFQHAFGMWGRRTEPLRDLIVRAKRAGAKTVCTFHTIHFESGETESGLTRVEEKLATVLLPLLDVCTVFSDGAYCALSRAFPQFQRKIVVLRHGVHDYLRVPRHLARKTLISYLRENGNATGFYKDDAENLFTDLASPETIVLGNCGFISADKDPLALYELGNRIRHECGNRRVITLYIGAIQDRRDRKTADSMGLLRDLRLIHDGRTNLFFEQYLPERMLPFAFRALDVCVFWYRNATQSGRMAHAQGAGTCVVGRRLEGLGETVDVAKLPSAVSMDDLTAKIVRLIRDPALKRETERLGQEYAIRYSFENQARKHLLVADAVMAGHELPMLDRTQADVSHVLPELAVASRRGLEMYEEENVAFLNVSDGEGLYPLPTSYRHIPLRDGTPVPPSDLWEAVEWIRRVIESRRVVVFCRYGMGRSASVAIAYLCSLGFAYRDAVKLVSVRRPGTNPLPELQESIEKAFRLGRITQRGSADLACGPTSWASVTGSQAGCAHYGSGTRQE